MTKRKSPARKPALPTIPIVGVGASAGGLEAFSQLLHPIPPTLGMAFVLIQHLDPTHPSHLVEALARKTKMPVQEIQDGMIVEAGNVYVIPPNATASMQRGAFVVSARDQRPGKPHLPIDVFFRALAAERRSQAIGVVLTGTASDGTEGLKAIRSEGGLAMVQDPGTARFSGMPASALAAGVVDLVLSIPDLVHEFFRLARHPYLTSPAVEPLPQTEDAASLQEVLAALRDAVGVDFGEYKETTIRRRLARRMAVRKADSLRDYAALLRENPAEADALFADILIHVTSFFRDPPLFSALKTCVFPEILKHKQPHSPLRMWVAGCSTGEEVYSLAISLHEFLEGNRSKRPIQIFGSDLSEAAIRRVRRGIYTDSAVGSLDPTQIQRFFVRFEGGYRIAKSIRDTCIFVRHDLTRDPPFAKLDLVSCRNLLIYFNPALQRRAIETFHYSLNTPGFLVLGHAESVPGGDGMFSTVDKVNRIFARAPATAARQMPVRARRMPARHDAAAADAPEPGVPVAPALELSKQVDRLLLTQYAPPGVIVDDRLQVLEFRGRTAAYLEPPSGEPQLNLFRMVREGLLSELRVALGIARREATTVRRDGVRFEVDGATRICNILVQPIAGMPETKERRFAVLFENAAPARVVEGNGKQPRHTRGKTRQTRSRHDAMEQELLATKDYLHSIIREHEATSDALASANDELVSGNEELQSMNEELESSKEELQSTNEELTTLNEELHNRNQELITLNNDITNLLNGVEIAIVIVDANLCIRRFTPQARRVMNLLPGDVGRLISDIRPNVSVPHLDQMIIEVMETIEAMETEVQDGDGRWYRLQIRPYKTNDNRIDGALLCLMDIDTLKRAQQDAEWGREYSAGIVEAVQVPLVVLDHDLLVQSANEAFYDLFQVPRERTEGASLYSLLDGQLDVADLRTHLGAILVGDPRFENLKVEVEVPQVGQRTLSLSARPVRSRAGMAPLILLSLEDITERERAERERERLLQQAREAEAEAAQATLAKDRFLAILSHDLRTPMSALLLHVDLLRRRAAEGAAIDQSIDAIERAARIQERLTDDLLDLSRISSGKLEMALERVDIAAVVREAIVVVRAMAHGQSVALEEHVDASVHPVMGDPVRLRQVVWNLLTNAIKYTPAGGRIVASVRAVDGHARIQVTDTGVGIEPDHLPRVFDVFSEAGSTRHGGLGLGLTIVRHVVQQHGGTVQAASPGAGQGATFTVTLPVIEQVIQDGAVRAVAGPKRMPTGDAHRAAGAPLDLEGVRVLVVEDELETREPLVEMLTGSGAEVRAAASVAEAMRVFADFRPQLLLSDIDMPIEDGYMLIRRIRALGPTRGGNVRAMALTAMASAPDRERALAAGFDLHFPKPVRFDELAAALLAMLHAERGVGHQ